MLANEVAAKRTRIPSFAFVLLPNFTLTAFSGFVDMLRLTADEGDRSKPLHCKWTILASKMAPVRASCGVEITPWKTFDEPDHYDYIVIVGGLLYSTPQADEATMSFIKSAGKSHATIVGVCTGTLAMLQAGILENYLCCVNWYHYQDFLERFPSNAKQFLADRLFVIDGKRISCPGGRASIDVAAAILRRHVSMASIRKALSLLVVDHFEGGNAPQPQPPTTEPFTHPKLKRAITLIEQHVSAPVRIDTLAQKLGISQRQLERLFKSESGLTPRAYIKRFQVRTAHWMLENTNKTVAAIASDCGFADASHLGRQLRDAYSLSPTQIRELPRGRG